MADSTTMTIRLERRTRDRLSELAGHTRRTRSFLAAEAIAAYVERELGIVAKIEQGRSHVAAGRVTSHDEVAADARSIIEAAQIRG